MLPIDDVLPDLLKVLAARPRAVLVAPPGAGKTTRVPLAILESREAAAWRGDGTIMVLEPRRLAARAAARRMATMSGGEVGGQVGYRMRLDRKVSAATRIEVITEGVFTARILADPGLDGVAAVLFDEFHERSLDADLGLALAIDAQAALRPDLRILVMSATLDGARVASLLGDAAVVESRGRAFPVETRHRPRDPASRIEDDVAATIREALATETGSILAFLPGQAGIRRVAERLAGRVPADTDIAPLYGALDGRDQDLAVAAPPAGRRKVVLATAIAETSLTIEGVRIVIDSGLARAPVYEPATGLTRLETRRVSRAAADQRRGRAGRTEPGIAIRLWPEGQTAALVAFDPPEMLHADLAPLALALADWGVADPAMLRWLDPPPRPAWQEAMELLRDLGALDVGGRLTAEGRALARLPLPPRLGHMLRRGAALGDAKTAAEIAAVLTERGLGGPDADLTHRLSDFRGDRSPRAADARALAARWAREAGENGARQSPTPAPAGVGPLLALAFPERVAMARGAPGRFVMANGRGVQIDPADALAREPFLAIAELQGTAENARILLAAPITRGEIDAAFGDRIVEETVVAFDSAAGAVRARRLRRLGRLVLADTAAETVDPTQVTAALVAAVHARGIAALEWGRAGTSLRERVAHLRRGAPEAWPDLSDAALLATLETWLAPYLTGKRRLAEIGPELLAEALSALLPWSQRAELDALAPTHFIAPTGNRHPIDYADPGGPRVAIRVQELFGIDRHPEAAGTPLTFELLSPAHRPIQITRDLPAFWQGSWRDVRADLRGRYPKHEWPEDPAAAAPTARAKPRRP